MIDRIRAKIIKMEGMCSRPKYIVLSKPPALELFYQLNDIKGKAHSDDKLISFEVFTQGKIFGLELIILQTNKEIVEVG